MVPAEEQYAFGERLEAMGRRLGWRDQRKAGEVIADIIEGTTADGKGHPRLAAGHRPATTDLESVQPSSANVTEPVTSQHHRGLSYVRKRLIVIANSKSPRPISQYRRVARTSVHFPGLLQGSNKYLHLLS